MIFIILFRLESVKVLINVGIIYCIVGKFGGNNVWQKYMDKDFGKNAWRMNKLTKRLLTII